MGHKDGTCLLFGAQWTDEEKPGSLFETTDSPSALNADQFRPSVRHRSQNINLLYKNIYKKKSGFSSEINGVAVEGLPAWPPQPSGPKRSLLKAPPSTVLHFDSLYNQLNPSTTCLSKFPWW